MKCFCCALAAIILCILFFCTAYAEMEYAPIPYDVERAPYSPHEECFLPDQAGYRDDSIDIRIERSNINETDYMAIYVTIADASQIRCGLAAEYPSQKTATVLSMAERFNGVLTINGDYFNYHKEGIVARNGELLRFRPTFKRDTLIIDDHGDFTILPSTTKEDYEAFEGNVFHAFCFGPWLVKDGVAITNEEIQASEVDIGKNSNTQRLALCQLGELSYLIVCTEGPSGGESKGLTIEQLANLCKDLGAIQAYNLDGGNSAAVIFHGEKINNVNNTKRRMIGDCVYFCTLVP